MDTRDLQARLNALGYGPLVVDGIAGIGSQTDQAIRRFQRGHGLFVDGIVGPKTEATVNEALKRPIGQNQFDACVSLCYNIGQEGFKGSTVVKRIKAG